MAVHELLEHHLMGLGGQRRGPSDHFLTFFLTAWMAGIKDSCDYASRHEPFAGGLESGDRGFRSSDDRFVPMRQITQIKHHSVDLSF